jgi:translation elongation factor P/translation initiation factor 5A
VALASQMRTGMAIAVENQNYRVVAAEYHPGQGQMGDSTHARPQNIDTGTFSEHSFRGDLRLPDLPRQRQVLEFPYMDSDQCWFMNPVWSESRGAKSSGLNRGSRLHYDDLGIVTPAG